MYVECMWDMYVASLTDLTDAQIPPKKTLETTARADSVALDSAISYLHLNLLKRVTYSFTLFLRR